MSTISNTQLVLLMKKVEYELREAYEWEWSGNISDSEMIMHIAKLFKNSIKDFIEDDTITDSINETQLPDELVLALINLKSAIEYTSISDFYKIRYSPCIESNFIMNFKIEPITIPHVITFELIV